MAHKHKLNTFHLLQEQEAAFSLTSYLDTIRLERAKSNPTQEMSSSPDNETDTCQPSPSGTTYAHSTEHPGEEQLMFFAEASHVRTSVRQVKEQELRRAFGTLEGICETHWRDAASICLCRKLTSASH
jgi:hypothetical protein